MLNLYINRWTISLILLIAGVISYYMGGKEWVIALSPILISFVIIGGVNKKEYALTITYISGVAIGISSLLWIYSSLSTILLAIYLFGPLKAGKLKYLWSMILGVFTPVWIILPLCIYYLMPKNTSYLSEFLASIL